MYASAQLAESMRIDFELTDGPVLSADHNDNVMPGGTCHMMDVDVLQATL